MCNDLKIEFINHQVCQLTLNRPAQHNALNQSLIDALSQTLNELENTAIRVLVLTGTGPFFCAGADLNEMAPAAHETDETNYQRALTLAHLFEQLNDLPLFTIANVNGPAYGGGIGLICCCDFVIASESAHFVFSELKLGLIPATIAPYVIPVIGKRQARRYLLSTEKIDCEHAINIGLIHEIVHSENINTVIQRQIKRVLMTGPEAFIKCKSMMINKPLRSETNMSASARQLTDIRKSDEAIEGVQAFLEKRKAHWIIEDD